MKRDPRHALAGILVGFSFAAVSCPAAASTPLDPRKAQETFQLEPGLALRLVAAEPLIRSPAALAWDEHARLHAVENVGYPTGPGPGNPPVGTLVRLDDRDGDGTVDTRTVVAEGLGFPNGLLPWKGGWLVTDAPNLLWLSDTNGDGRADVREVWFTGFATNQTTQLRACYPTVGPDGWIHIARGLSAGVVTSPKWPSLPPVDLKGGDFRFRPDGTGAEAVGGNAQFGLVVDDLGRRFLVSNRNPLMHAVVDPRWWARHPWLPFPEVVQDVSPSGYEARVFPRSIDTTTAGFMPEFMAAPHAGSFTAACGIHPISGDGLGPDLDGSWLICEPAQNLVQRQHITPSGPTFTSVRATPDHREFLASTDSWFHPVHASTGPDGAIYLADLYRGIIDHPEYLPEDIRGRVDFSAGKELGRIWRIASSNAPRPAPRRLAGLSTEELVQTLGDSNGWVRQTAHRLLLERPAPARQPFVVEALKRDLDGSAPPPSRHAELGTARRVRLAVDTHRALAREGALPADAEPKASAWIRKAAFSPSATVREAALRALLDPPPKSSADLGFGAIDWIPKLAADNHPAVRFQALLALSTWDRPADNPALRASILRTAALDAADRWSRAAALLALSGHELDGVRTLCDETDPGRPDPGPLLADLGRVLGANPNADAAGFLRTMLSADATDATAARSERRVAALRGFADGLQTRGAGPLSRFVENMPAPAGGGESPAAVLARIGQQAQALARATNTALPARVDATRFLSELPPAEALESLAPLLDASLPGEVRLAALRAVGRLNMPEAGRLITAPDRWRAYTPAMQQAAVSALTSRPALLGALLDALDQGALPPWVVGPAQRKALMNHSDATVKERARRLFTSVGGGDRLAVYASLKPVAARPGNGTSGHTVFLRTCAACHRHGAEGVQVGPDLSGVHNQPAEALLLHILVPDAEIYPGYQAYQVETRDGRSLTGLLVAESEASVTLRRTGGEVETLQRSLIASFELSPVSLMPQELEKTMTEAELADLLAFLRGHP